MNHPSPAHRRLPLFSMRPILLASLLLAPLHAAEPPKPVEPVATWKGSVEDEAKLAECPTVLTDAKTLAKLWTTLGAEGDPPAIDFATHFLALETTRGSLLRPMARLSDSGDLSIMSMGTRDLRPGFRYVLAQFALAGVSSVNGKPLAAAPPTLTGSVVCKAGGAIPEGATATISLRDVSLADAPSKTLAQHVIPGPAAFPLPFQLTFDPTKLRLEHTHFYSLGIRVEKAGKLLFINDTHISISKDGKLLQNIQAPVIPVLPFP